MRVYNLSKRDLHFRKVVLSANGGSRDFPELDNFIPDSDKRLAEAKVISFGSLPKWWVAAPKPAVLPEVKQTPVVIVMESSDTIETAVESHVGTSESGGYHKKKKYQYTQTKE